MNNGQIMITKREHGQNEQQQGQIRPHCQQTSNHQHLQQHQPQNQQHQHPQNHQCHGQCHHGHHQQPPHSPFVHLRNLNGVESYSMMRRLIRMSSGNMSADETASD